MKKLLTVLLLILCVGVLAGCSKPINIPDVASKVEETKDKVKEEVKLKSNNDDVPEILTIDNCEELKNILNGTKFSSEDLKDFCKKYPFGKVEFDGAIDLVNLIPGKMSRYEMLFRAGDYDPNTAIGSSFKFRDFSRSDNGVEAMAVNGTLVKGQNIHIVAKIEAYDSYAGTLNLKLESMSAR